MKVFSYSLQLIRYRPGHYIACFFLWLFFLNIPLLSGLLLQAIFNSLSDQAPVEPGIWLAIALLVGAELSRGVFNFCSNFIFNRFSLTLEVLLRKNLLSWLVGGPGSRKLPSTTGEALTRFRDDPYELISFFDTWIDLSCYSIFALGAFVIMANINLTITLFVFVPLALVIYITHLLTPRVKTFRENSRKAAGQVTGFIGQMFVGVQTIKVTNAEESVISNFKNLNAARQKIALREQVFSVVLESFNLNISNLGIGLILLVGAQTVQDKSFTVGDFALFVSYLGWVNDFPRWVARLLTRYKQAEVSIGRMTELVAPGDPQSLVRPGKVYLKGELPAVTFDVHGNNQGHSSTLLAVNGLTYHYPESRTGIENINLLIEPGSLTVITGRIGSGKTTLLKCLLGLLPKESGQVKWKGHSIEDTGSFLVPPQAAYVPQLPHLFSETLRDNILQGRPEYHLNLTKAVRLSVLETDIAEFKKGLETELGSRGVRLSGGQRQRTAVARMAVSNSELWVLDDVSNALDVETEKNLWQRIFENKTATILAVSHRPSLLKRADNIVVLKNGQVEAAGKLETLLENCVEMQNLWLSDIEQEKAEEVHLTRGT
jgi:ATP-binding cassette subfamily B protein